MTIYLVGGAVRDRLLGFPFVEKDWVVVGSSPKEMLQQGYTPVGKDFPVFLHPTTHEEYALARTERKTAPGYKGFTFHTDLSVSLEQDLYRRDLTINAIAQNNEGELIDPYHGQADIKQKLLRHVSPAFAEDPVRILRIARFAARYHHLGFTIADDTIAMIHSMVEKGETQHLVAERVWQECYKALSEKSPALFFRTLEQCHALEDIFPALESGEDVNRAVALLEHISQAIVDPASRLAAFCFALKEDGIIQLMAHVGAPNECKDLALLTQQFATIIYHQQQWTAQNIVRLFQKTDALRKPERFENLLTIWANIAASDHPLTEVSPAILTTFMQGALAQYKNVNPQTLIQQGYEKSALGEAIKTVRQENIQAWLNSQTSL